MASGIINWIIDKYLSNILEINKDLTKSSLFSGELQMANLTIKPEIFNLLNLPFFDLIHGYVGKLRIKVKLPRIHLHPIKVEVENVFFHAKQKKLSNLKKEEEIIFMENNKISQLQSLEEFKNELNNYKDDTNPNMLSKLINNIDLNISNICIRFDDEISYSLIPFCLGVLVKNIKFKTVDKDFKEVEGKYSLPFEEINNKKIEIDNISIYLDTFENEGKLVEYNQKIIDTQNTKVKDAKLRNFLGSKLNYYRFCLSEIYENINNYSSHDYILFNFKFLLLFSINENLKNGKPKVDMHCNIKEIKLGLNLVQTKAIFKLSIYQELMLKYHSGLSKEYYTKKLTEEEKMEYIDNYINYCNLMYSKKPNEKKANKIKVVLNKFEDKLKYEEIQMMRNLADFKSKHSNTLELIDNQLKEMKSDKKLFKKKGFLNKKNKEEDEKIKEKLKEIEELEQKKLKFENIVSNLIKKNINNIEELSEFFQDASDNITLLRINFEINEIQINVKRIQEEKLFTIDLVKTNFFCDIKNKQQFLTLTINDISIMQYQLPQSKYQMIMSTIKQRNERFSEREKGKINACYIEFENNPKYDNSNYRIKFRNQKRIIFIANIFSIQYISKKLSDYLTFFMDRNFDFPEKYNVTGEIYKFIKDGFIYDHLEEKKQQHFNAELDVTIKSPILLFPIDILDNSNKKCILIRCGDFHMYSLLPPRQDPKINYAKVKERMKLVDTYMFKGEKLCVTTLDDFNGDLSGLLDAKGSNLIQDVSFGLNADIMFEEKNPYFEKFKFCVNVGRFKINVRDIQLPFFMEMIEKSGKLLKLAKYELEHKTYFEKKEIKFNKDEEETYITHSKKNLNLFKEDKKEENDEEELQEIKNDDLNDFENANELENININQDIINNDRALFKKREENAKIDDPKFILVDFTLDSFHICIQKTISYEEREILSKSNEDIKNLRYRDFIILDLNYLKINFLLTEKINCNVTLLIKSIGILDKETLITNVNNPQGDYYIDKEFQNIIKMDSGENSNEIQKEYNYQSFMSNDYIIEDAISVSDINEVKKIDKKNKLNTNDKYAEYFMVLNFSHNNETETQLADILFKNIKICISMSSLTRILQFTDYYLEMFNKIIEENIIVWNNMEREHKKEKIKNRLLKKMNKNNNNILLNSSSDSISYNSSTSGTNDDSDEESESDDTNKLFDSKFVSKLASDINKNKEKSEEEEILLIDTSSENKKGKSDDINIINSNLLNNRINENADKEIEKSLKDNEIKLTKIFRTKNNKINIKIKFEMRQASIIFPLDDSKSVTRVLQLKSNINGNISLKANIDLIRNGHDELIKVNFKENNMKTGIKILNVELNMLNYKNGKYSIDNICDRILTGFRFSININSILLLPKKEQTITLVNIDLEPLVFNIGFTQVKDLIKFIPVLTEFLSDIKAEYDDPIKEIKEYDNIEDSINNNLNNINNEDEEINENNIINKIEEEDTNITNSIKNNDIINIEEENKKNEDKIKEENNKTDKDKRRLRKKKENKKNNKVSDGKVQVNIVEMNNTIDVKIHMEKTLIKIIDDSGYYLQPLINIEFREPPIKLIINTNSDSVKNITNLLIESISRKEISLKNYDIKGLALYGEIYFSFSVTYYNNRIDDWEPIIEKYGASITLDQITWFSRLRVLYNSNDMLNLNLSFSILCFINEVLKKILSSNSIDSKISTSADDRIAIEFINSSGINMTCWLDANDPVNNTEENRKFILDSNPNSKKNKMKIKRSKLNYIYSELTDAQLKIKKDKFSFKLNGFLPVTANDFSSNYSTSFKLKKEVCDLNNRYMVNDSKDEIQNRNTFNLDINKDEKKLLLLSEQLLPENNDNIIDTSSIPQKNISINEEDEDNIGIFLKIRKNGAIKSIVFESNIFFYNNLPVPISLSLISENDFRIKYNSNDNNINHENNKDKLILNSGAKKSLSLLYLIKKYRIYISFYNYLNKNNNYSLLYKNLDELKHNYQNCVKYEEENLPTYKGKKETELNDYYSKLVTVQYKNKNYYISSNLIIQRGFNDIIKTEPKEIIPNFNIMNLENKIESNENKINFGSTNGISSKKCFSYLFILSGSLVIENQLPFNIKCEIDVENKKEMLIRPLQKKYFLDFDKQNTKLRIILKYQNIIFKSKFFDVETIEKNKEINKEDIDTTIKLYEEVDEAINLNKYIECNIKVEENIENDKFIGAYEKEFEHNVKSFSKKRKIIIYTECIIVNKSDILLYIFSNNVRIENFSSLEYNGKMYPNCINLFHTKYIKNAFKLKSEKSNWSEKFNINTIGNVGVISLEINEDNNKVSTLEIGVSISSSWSFPNSLFITIEPRFLLINRFGYDLQYKQYNNKKDKISNDHGNIFKDYTIKNGQKLKLNLLKDTKNMKKMIQLNMGQYSIDYSCPIDLDEIGDIDVKIPINEEMKEKILNKNLEIENEIEKIKKKERNKKKLQFIENKKLAEDKINNINNYNNILNSKNDNEIININNSNENIISTNSDEIKDEINFNISEDNSESDVTTIDEEEIFIDIFSFSKKSKRFLQRNDGKKELTPNEEKIKKLKEKKKKLQQYQMKPRKYFIFSQNNISFLLVRITKAIYKGLIYIVIFPPENPQYIIKNETNYSITLSQKEDNFNHENIILEKGSVLPYAWGDTLKNEKLLNVSIDNNDIEINLNEIKVLKKKLEITKQFLLNNNQNTEKIKKNEITKSFFFQTTVENNKTRTLIVKSKHQSGNNSKITYLERIKEQRQNSFNVKVKLYTKGFGVSIINSIPKEMYYISVYGFLLESQFFNFNKDHCNHIIANMRISLKNLQVDYCFKDLFKSTIIPKTQINPQIEEVNQNNNENDALIPLFQGIISFHRITNHLISVTSDEFPQLDFTIQPIKVNISNYQIMSIIDFGIQLKEELDFYLTETEKTKKFTTIDELEKSVSEEISKNNKSADYEPEHYSHLLNTELEVLPEEIIFNSEKRYMFFIKNIALGSVVIILTTRIDFNSFRVIPIIISGLSSFIGNIFTHITDYNLYLPSTYYTDVFTDINTLIQQLKNSYLSQLKRRIFKIIGSLDILGNPTGYASAISKGFLEIFEAPRRGLIHGPLGFGEGVAKGFGKFLTTVISSSFDFVGKISGTLLVSCEELQGIKNIEYLSEREPSNIFSGLYYGVKNGIIDIGKGVAGIFIKPYEEAKKGGIGGFFQGMGAGLIGAAVSPFTAGLRITNNLFVGIKNTALIFNPKLETERFRYPRTIQKAIRLNTYNEDEALVRAILDYLEGYEEHEIIYFKQFKYINPGLQNSISTLILTDKCVMIVYQATELVFKIELDLIKRVEVHKEPNNINIDLIFYLKNNTKKYIVTNDFSLCVDFYLMLENVKE